MKVRKQSYDKYLMEVLAEYQRIHGDAVDMSEVAKWAHANQKVMPKKYDPVKALQRDFAKAAKTAYTIDPKGREVRRMISVPIKGENGQMFLWVTMNKARPDQFRLSHALRREGIVADVRRHQRDHLSYNDFNEHGAQVPLFDYDLNKTLAEDSLPTEYPESDPDRE